MEEDSGFWRRTILPQLRIAYKRSHLTSAATKYLSGRQAVGATSYDNPANLKRRGTGKQVDDEQKRLYPAGAPLSKSERAAAWDQTPVDAEGGKM